MPPPATPDAVISDSDRYSRQTLFAPIGPAGQQKLASAHVAIVGIGATGAATASLLARSGVGTLTLIDRDFVEPSNLQRQVLFTEADAHAHLPKAEAARRHIIAFHSGIAVHAKIADLIPANIAALLAGAHLICDCTDNFETRYLLNDYSAQAGTPWIYAGAVGSSAATMNILPRQGPWSRAQALNPEPSTACLACIFPSAPTGVVATCETAGILATAVNFAASIQSTEALKFLTGNIAAMRRTFLSADLWLNTRSEIDASAPDPDCNVCGARIFTHLSGAARPHITLCGRNSVQIHEHARPLDLTALATRLAPLGLVRANGLLLRFEYAPYTLTVFPDGRALIQGTTDTALARSLYARFIGS